MDPAQRNQLIKKAITAQCLLIVYNLFESALSIFFGLSSGSIALLGFGLDSIAELLSSTVVALRLRKTGKLTLKEEIEHEMNASRLVGIFFIIIAAYISFTSIRKLALREIPQFSLAGAVIAIASLIIMPVFAKYRHDLGHRIDSKSLIADSRQTRLCAYLAGALLLGILLNFLFGWWWADPLSGLIISVVAILEGKDALEGKTCC